MTVRAGALLALVLACTPPQRFHRISHTEAEQGDRRIGQYVSSQWSFHTASYWLEGPEGLVLVDTQFLPSATRKTLEAAEPATGKKPVLAVVLHPNPDRFNGTDWLHDVGVRTVTSAQVRAHIPAAHARWAPVFFETYRAGRYPPEAVLPEAFGERTQALRAAGLTLTAHVLGAGCSPAHVVLEWEGHLFVGDLVSNGAHSWFEGGDVEAWLQRLAELRALRPRWVHPGRGPTGGPELLDAQEAYLRAVVAEVAAERARTTQSPEALARVVAHLRDREPRRTFETFLPALVRAEWDRQAAAGRETAVRCSNTQDEVRAGRSGGLEGVRAIDIGDSW